MLTLAANLRDIATAVGRRMNWQVYASATSTSKQKLTDFDEEQVENDSRERTSTEAFCVRSARLKSKTGNNVANSYRALLHYDILHVEICQPDRRNDVLRWRKVAWVM